VFGGVRVEGGRRDIPGYWVIDRRRPHPALFYVALPRMASRDKLRIITGLRRFCQLGWLRPAVGLVAGDGGVDHRRPMGKAIRSRCGAGGPNVELMGRPNGGVGARKWGVIGKRDMPELPEVETMRRGIAAVVGRRVVSAGRLPCERRPIGVTPGPHGWRRVVGRTITAVERVGKRVVVVLDSGDRLIFEPRMTGLVLLVDPPTTEHLRFCVDLSTQRQPLQLLYWDRRGLGSVRLMTADEFRATFFTGKVGPDALAVSRVDFPGRFAGSRQPIKVALLDQRRVAGLGNLEASEFLFFAGLHPVTPCDQLSESQWEAIYQRMREVLETAIRYEGSTLSDGTYRTALNQSGGYQNHHRVYDRAALPCSTCGQPIERIVQAQRSTFFCSHCQPQQRRRAVRKAAGKTARRSSVDVRGSSASGASLRKSGRSSSSRATLEAKSEKSDLARESRLQSAGKSRDAALSQAERTSSVGSRSRVTRRGEEG